MSKMEKYEKFEQFFSIPIADMMFARISMEIIDFINTLPSHLILFKKYYFVSGFDEKNTPCIYVYGDEENKILHIGDMVGFDKDGVLYTGLN